MSPSTAWRPIGQPLPALLLRRPRPALAAPRLEPPSGNRPFIATSLAVPGALILEDPPDDS
ncbi:MAG: hypothetical protein OZSIB_3526 [Candidatus Ozemobacter sibiricus]|uniref:Uncharacterized protein n=1 Tax=Candidatus Ozemobacter sibiricus TaxID=2268124 RepID=A0A367ZQB8_9BACT|nr:MAG: hypothetical protein OZSIB_3526 [Candidatus Ozemobacter sibiricus]